jgi:hypothetical protein
VRKYYCGVDLGQSNDSTAIVLIEAVAGTLHCGHIERVPLGTDYLSVVARVEHIMNRLPPTADLVVDASGCGRPVADMLTHAGLDFQGIVISGGVEESTLTGGYRSVPKATLISHVQAALHSGTLKIQADLPETPILLRELEDFRVSFSGTGHMSFNARGGRHDDIVLALSLAVWAAKRHDGNELRDVSSEVWGPWRPAAEPSEAENWRQWHQGFRQGTLTPRERANYVAERKRRGLAV